MSEIAYQNTPTQVKEGQVVSQLDRQSRELDELHGTINELEQRLAPVLLAQDTATPDSGQPREVMAPIAERIASHNDSISSAAARLTWVIRSLEL